MRFSQALYYIYRIILLCNTSFSTFNDGLDSEPVSHLSRVALHLINMTNDVFISVSLYLLRYLYSVL